MAGTQVTIVRDREWFLLRLLRNGLHPRGPPDRARCSDRALTAPSPRRPGRATSPKPPRHGEASRSADRASPRTKSRSTRQASFSTSALPPHDPPSNGSAFKLRRSRALLARDSTANVIRSTHGVRQARRLDAYLRRSRSPKARPPQARPRVIFHFQEEAGFLFWHATAGPCSRGSKTTSAAASAPPDTSR